MKSPPQNLPDKNYAAQVVRQVKNESVVTVSRFAAGLCHFVYDVVTESGQSFVLRAAKPQNRAFLEGALYWHRLLKLKGIPLPDIIYSDTKAVPFPFMMLERLAGEDLGIIYQQLSKDEKKILAGEISDI